MQKIASGLLENAFTLLCLVKKILLIVRADQIIIRIHPVSASRLRIFCFDHADRRKLHVHLVIDFYTDDIVFFTGYFEGLFEGWFTAGRGLSIGTRTGAQVRGGGISVEKIAEEEDDGFLPRAAVEEADGFAEIGAFAFGFDGQQLTDDVEDVFPAFLRRDIAFYPVAEENDAYLIVVVDGGEGQHGAELRDQILFPGMCRAEEGAGADVDKKHDGQLAFFLEQLAKGMVEARRDIPVDEADVIAGSILTHLAEAHATALEGTMVFAREKMAEGMNSVEAAMEAGYTRMRPVIMTAMAMMIGMVPMAMGFGEGGEQNAPLGRAVIGGLLFATVATLFFVPVIFSIMHRHTRPVLPEVLEVEQHA